MHVLRYLAGKLAWEEEYTEQKVNDILNEWHTFADPALLRRELYMKHFVDRTRDGRKYWRTVRQIPAQWMTKHLSIADAKRDDVPDLQTIYDNCAYIGEWTGYDDQRKEPMLAEFNHENLPPNGKKELNRLQSIRLRKEKKLIGYIALYHGFPDRDTLWIAVLAIHTAHQKQKFGQEVVEELSSIARDHGYAALGAGVGIKNWPALRFWIQSGFTTILKFEGDRECKEKTFADLWLSKPL